MAVKKVFNLFCDGWHLYRKYILRKLNEKDLDEFIRESEKLFQKYDQDPFAKDSFCERFIAGCDKRD